MKMRPIHAAHDLSNREWSELYEENHSWILVSGVPNLPKPQQMRIAEGIFDQTLATSTAAYPKEKHPPNFDDAMAMLNTAANLRDERRLT